MRVNDEINAIFGKDDYLREKNELSKKQIKNQYKKKKKKSSHSNDEMRNKLHQKIDNKKNTRGQSSVQTQLLENSKQLQDIVKQEASGKKISEEEINEINCFFNLEITMCYHISKIMIILISLTFHIFNSSLDQ